MDEKSMFPWRFHFFPLLDLKVLKESKILMISVNIFDTSVKIFMRASKWSPVLVATCEVWKKNPFVFSKVFVDYIDTFLRNSD